MNARLSTSGLMQRFKYLFVALVLSFFSSQNAAQAAQFIDRHVNTGAEAKPLEPRAEPYALRAGSGKVNVRFSVRLTGKAKPSATVYLRRSGSREAIAMNDQGRNGDLFAKDGIYGANVTIDTSGLKPDTCLKYEALVRRGRAEAVSSPLRLCVSAFPVRAAASNTARADVLPDGSKAVADEILITAKPNLKSDAIRRLAADINARVVGSIPPLDLYQLKLSAPVSSGRLIELVGQLSARAEVKTVSVNAIGSYAYTPSDPEFVNQHGLKMAIAHNAGTGANAWDAGAIGTGVIVTVLDSGLDKSHPDFGTPGNCQLAENDCGAANTDTVGHGTWVAGVVGAKTNNALGVAGVAYGSKIHSIIVGGGASPSLLQMTQGFTDAAAYGVSSVINASFDVTVSAFTNVSSLCSSINSAVLSGATPVAVVVNASGNSNSNGYYYPGRCNVNDLVSHVGQHEALTRKDLFITVANSTSGGACTSVDQLYSTSNYGAWVDIAAPGCDIRTTALVSAGSYTSVTGTSFSAPMVSGAAAILKSCGVALDQIEPTLRTSANVTIPFPDATSAPRLDIYRALHVNAPSATNLSAAETYVEDTPLDLTNIVVSDLNGCATITATLTLSVSTAGTLSTATSGTVTSTFAGGVWSASGPLADVNVLLAGVMFSPAPNYNGNFSIATSISDGAAPASTGLKVMTGVAVNDAPSFVKGADQTLLEDAGAQSVPNWATGISAGPADEAGQTLNFIITGNTNPGLFSTPPAISPAGDLTYTSAPNANGSATITVQLHDNGGTANGGVDTSAPQSFTINVTPVNDAPTFMKGPDQSVSDNAGPQTVPGWATAISAGPADEAGQALNFIISGNTNPGLFSTPPAISATGDLTYTPMLGGNGSATITIQLHDNGGTANGGADTSALQTFTINVTHIPVPPSGVVGIDGVRQVSAPQPSLHANTSGVINPDGWTVNHYQWRESVAPPPLDTPAAIGGATNVDYQLVLSDVGKYMSVCAIYSDPAVTQLCSGTDTIAVGDPHITTVDGLHYDFQSAGEFVSLRNSSGMEIQVRQTPVSTATPLTDAYSGLTSGVSVNSAVAARVGKHRVTYQADANNNTASGAPVLRVDGVVTTLPAEGIDFGDEGRVTPQGSGIQLDFPDQTTLIVSSGQWINNVWWMHLSVYHTSAYEGIMGARLKGSWLPRLSDGSALGAMPASLHDRYVQLYGKFADSWRVTGKTSLFDYAEGTSTATFTNKAWPTENGPYVAGPGPVAKPLGRNFAMQACRDVAGKNEKADCVFDVMVMGNKNIAKGHLQIQNVRLGATQVIVRGAGRPDAHGDMVFTATVARQATILPRVRNIRAVPVGMVQFLINGEKAGAPVKLDEKGQVRWKVPYQRLYKQRVTAQYIPAKGSIFLPSSRIVRMGLVLEKK